VFDEIDNGFTLPIQIAGWGDLKIATPGGNRILQVTVPNAAATPASVFVMLHARVYEYNTQNFQLRLNDGTTIYPSRAFNGTGWGAGFDGPTWEQCGWFVSLPAGTTRTYTVQGNVTGWSPSAPGITSLGAAFMYALLFKKV